MDQFQSGPVGIRMSLPRRSTGVGHAPVRISSYAAVAPMPRLAATVTTSTTGGRLSARAMVMLWGTALIAGDQTRVTILGTGAAVCWPSTQSARVLTRDR